MEIVLFEPEIPPNTGNVARLCAVTGTRLHLIEPLGFKLEDRYLKRAGLDYWERLSLTRYMNSEAFLAEHPGARIWYVTTKGRKTYAEVTYGPDDYLMFGRESAGIPEEILAQHPEECIRIPMREGERSLNLSNSVSIVLYEALRQLDFPELQKAAKTGDGSLSAPGSLRTPPS